MNHVSKTHSSLFDIDFAFLSLFLTILLQWIIVQEVGGFLLRPFHIGMLLVFASVALSKNFFTYARGLFKVGHYFFVLALLFIIMELVSLFWTKRLGPGLSGIFRQSLYIALGFAIATKVANIHSLRTIKTIFFGCFFGIIVFFVTITIYLNHYGINFITGYYSALVSRNLATLVGFFAKVYLQLGGAEEWHTGTLRHLFSGIFIAMALSFRATAPVMKRTVRHRALLVVLEVLLYTCTMLIVIMSLSRTAMLTLLTILSLFVLISMLTGKLKIRIALPILFIVSILVTLPILLYDFSLLPTMVEMVWSRFFTATKGYESRLDMYVEASVSINRYVLLGLGFGAESQEYGYQIHNFFLNAWFQLGLIGFTLATLLYTLLALFWLQQMIRLVMRPHSWVIGIAPEPVMALPIFPMIRMLVGGSPFQTVLEWFPFGLFFGFIFANERTLRRQKLWVRCTQTEVE